MMQCNPRVPNGSKRQKEGELQSNFDLASHSPCLGVRKRVVSKRMVLADVPRDQKNPERGHMCMFSGTKSQISHGVENRGSLISAPLALRVAKRPASYRDSKPRTPKFLEKNQKITPRAPTPNSLKNTQESRNTKITRKILFSR